MSVLIVNQPNERSLKNDLSFGLTNEANIVRFLNETFSDTFINTKDKYNDEYYVYDYEGETTELCAEVKSRRNTYYAYRTTILPTSKVVEGKKQVFVFHFICGGIGYIYYDKEKFSTYRVEDIVPKEKRKGINDFPKPHFHIPVRDLIRIK
jgi:hypothetical protein